MGPTKRLKMNDKRIKNNCNTNYPIFEATNEKLSSSLLESTPLETLSPTTASTSSISPSSPDKIWFHMDLQNRKFNMSPIKTEDKVLFFGTAALSMTMIGYSLSKGTGAMMRFINKWEIPSVIRETSVTSVYDYLKNPVIAIRKIGERRALKESLNKLVFTEQINNKYQELVGTTTYAATQKLRTNRRNVMVYGPPGNGKSSFVRKIAINSGVHYAVINGIDLMSRNQKLVPEIQKLFDWIYKRRSNPFVLLVLKADEFFNNRTNEHIREATCIFSEKLKNNNFNSLMVLMTADNQIHNIKINDYINDFVFILTPEKEQKLKLIRIYAEKYILSVEDKYRKELESIYDEIASATKNMSCQDIEMLVKLWKILLYESKSDKNPKQIILECCYQTIQDNKKKMEHISKPETFEHLLLIDSTKKIICV